MSNTPSHCWPEKIGRKLTLKLRAQAPCLTGRLLIVHLKDGEITSCQTRHHKNSAKLKNVRANADERNIVAVFANGNVVKIEMHARQITFEFGDDLALAKHARTFEGLVNGICHARSDTGRRRAGVTADQMVQATAS